jgi:cell division transport system ATP-binding protein
VPDLIIKDLKQMEYLNEIVHFDSCNIYHDKLMVLQNVNLQIEKGEFVYLIGKTGSGKSSLLKSIYGALAIKEGGATVAGVDMTKMKPSKAFMLRRKLGMVFQDFLLLSDRSVHDNLLFSLKAMGWRNKLEIKNRIEEVLEQVNLKYIGHKLPHQLSGGEQQRVAIARAILNKPELLIADEPTGNLDPDTTDDIVQLISNINLDFNTTVLFATHDYRIMQKFPANVLICREHSIFRDYQVDFTTNKNQVEQNTLV